MADKGPTAGEFAAGYISMTRAAAPFVMHNGELFRFSGSKGHYEPLTDASLAHELCAQFDVHHFRNTKYYHGVCNDIRLRSSRIQTDGCPQAFIRNGLQVLSVSNRLRDWIAFRNGVFKFRTLQQGRRALTKRNPRFFTKAVRPYDYDPDAVCPVWHRCLEE